MTTMATQCFTPDDLLRQAENNSIISENQRGAEIAMLEWAAQRITELENVVWQPIETAPRDGTWVVLTDGSAVGVAYWGGTYFGSDPAWVVYAHRSEFELCHVDKPTHWMPLPTPPEEDN